MTIPIDVKDGRAMTRDVSGIGIAFQSDEHFDVGSGIDFLLRLPDVVNVRCRGRVVRSDAEGHVAVTIDEFVLDGTAAEAAGEGHIVIRELKKHHGG